MSKRSLLVPHDFTHVADNAVQYAMNLATVIDADVDLLHIVKDKKDIKKNLAKLEDVVAKVKDKPAGVELRAHCITGHIYTEIAAKAAELHSRIIVMGTHGAKGMQKLFGSFAIKVITSTHVPFLVVQDDSKGMDLSKIVVPIDESQESLQIEQVVSGIAEIAKSEVHVVSEKKIDSGVKLTTAVHAGLLIKQFKEHGIANSSTVLDKKKGYASDIVTYAKTNGANLIAFAYHSDSLLPQFDTFAQNLITNKDGVPVMVINSKEAGNYFF